MNLAKALRDHYLRIDARSLGLFRLTMGGVLLYDLFRRWKYIKEFYSNDGVLPNHNHLFNLKDKVDVWSLLHSISSTGEAHAAFCVILFFYLCFLVGFRTRAFHVASLVCLVSLTGRNILLENAGNYAAIALLAFTAFLPLGSRFSLDSLRAAMDARDEKTARALNDRKRPSQDALDGARAPGWTPTSIAAFATLAQIAIIFLVSAVVQKGEAWHDGSALYYALNSERFISAAGASARGFLGPGALAAWTRAFHLAEYAIPALIVLPFAWRITRNLAAGLVLFTGLTLGIFFSLGLYGWTLAASFALLIPVETWERVEGQPNPRRARTMVYDADCGVCLLLARLLKRLDIRGNITFQGNDDLDGLNRTKDGKIVRDPLPKEVTAELVQTTVIAVDPQGGVHTRARAVAEIVQAIPLGWLIAWAIKLPGIVDILNKVYDAIAERRQRISVALGKEACGIDTPHGDAEEPAPALAAPAPSTILRRRVVGLGREAAAAVVLWAALAQTTQANDISTKINQPKWLAGVAGWPRMMARWDVFAPEPPREDEIFVADAQTRGGRTLDPFTGRDPEFNPGALRGTGLGQLWNDYLYRIHLKEWFDFQRAFRDYVTKGGPAWDEQIGDNALSGLDAYWVKQPIPRPGEPREQALSAKDKLFTQSRGGRTGAEKTLPLLKPDLFKR
jgi:predicted DCC family thiol-disulfide oxidoreductase YuxK